MKKGFTLVELMGILAILGIIILVAVPSLLATNKNSTEMNYREFQNTVNEAAETYIEINGDKYQDLKNNNAASTVIDVDTLVNEGLLQSGLMNPETEKSITDENGSVTVINENGVLKYTYNAA